MRPIVGALLGALWLAAGGPALELPVASAGAAPAETGGAAGAADPASLPPEAAGHLEAGDVAFRAFDSVTAAAEYRKAAELAPESYEALAKATLATRDAGEHFKVEGNKDQAERYFEQARALAQEMLRRYPDRGESHYFAASTAGQLALFRGARAKVRLSREIAREAKAAIVLDPADGRPHAVLGVYYREVANANAFTKMLAKTLLGGLPDGTNEDAERELLRAVELNPSDVHATYELAETYRVMKRPEREQEYLKKVVELPATAQRDPRLKAKAAERLAALGAR